MYAHLRAMYLLIWQFQQECVKEGETYLTSDRTGSCNTYTTITDKQLCAIVREIQEILPDAGETYIIGTCRQSNISVQHQRIKDAINIIDPINRRLRGSFVCCVECTVFQGQTHYDKRSFTMFDYVTEKVLYFGFFIFLLRRSILKVYTYTMIRDYDIKFFSK